MVTILSYCVQQTFALFVFFLISSPVLSSCFSLMVPVTRHRCLFLLDQAVLCETC